MIAGQESIYSVSYRKLVNSTLNELREGADLSCSDKLFHREAPL
jgi:hypothetical protein